MIISIVSNYVVGLLINRSYENTGKLVSPKIYLGIGISINVGLLVSFKYANFISDNIDILLSVLSIPRIDLVPIHLPLGISFFTFQAISYIVDVYKKECEVQESILDLALYISLFPQLIAGPIVRYHDISSQITGREHTVSLFSSGVRRFIYGLSKKLLLANPLGEVADNVFLLSGPDLTMPLAWIGILAYALQIYFDFSGYSDMAIGLGRIFGFRFLENFNYPYIARSIREFWRRWHISLSTWFRDYVYIPLGGSRVSTWRIYLNLLTVFILTGIWHGASWNFVFWGLFHGAFLTIEHIGKSRLKYSLWRPLQHLYIILVVLVSWVIFRAESMEKTGDYLSSMINVSQFATEKYQIMQVMTIESMYVFIIAMMLSFPISKYIKGRIIEYCSNSTFKMMTYFFVPRILLLLVLMSLCVLKIASSTYNPFIYFRF